jgi:hypothetical protein
MQNVVPPTRRDPAVDYGIYDVRHSRPVSYTPYSASVDTNDPGSWNAASYVDDPIDHIELLDLAASEYRQCALQLLGVLRGIDAWMSTGPSGRPHRKWVAVSLALGLSSTHGQTETAIAAEWGVTRAAISKDVVKVLGLTQLEKSPAWGLKTFQDRETYARTNGRRRLEHRLGDMSSEPNVGDFPST